MQYYSNSNTLGSEITLAGSATAPLVVSATVAASCSISTTPVSFGAYDPASAAATTSTGSANHLARLCLLPEPPSLDRGEVTDKGSINQRAVLAHRADTVAALHADTLRHILKPSAMTAPTQP